MKTRGEEEIMTTKDTKARTAEVMLLGPVPQKSFGFRGDLLAQVYLVPDVLTLSHSILYGVGTHWKLEYAVPNHSRDVSHIEMSDEQLAFRRAIAVQQKTPEHQLQHGRGYDCSVMTTFFLSAFGLLSPARVCLRRRSSLTRAASSIVRLS